MPPSVSIGVLGDRWEKEKHDEKRLPADPTDYLADEFQIWIGGKQGLQKRTSQCRDHGKHKSYGDSEPTAWCAQQQEEDDRDHRQ